MRISASKLHLSRLKKGKTFWGSRKIVSKGRTKLLKKVGTKAGRTVEDFKKYFSLMKTNRDYVQNLK